MPRALHSSETSSSHRRATIRPLQKWSPWRPMSLLPRQPPSPAHHWSRMTESPGQGQGVQEDTLPPSAQHLVNAPPEHLWKRAGCTVPDSGTHQRSGLEIGGVDCGGPDRCSTPGSFVANTKCKSPAPQEGWTCWRHKRDAQSLRGFRSCLQGHWPWGTTDFQGSGTPAAGGEAGQTSGAGALGQPSSICRRLPGQACSVSLP